MAALDVAALTDLETSLSDIFSERLTEIISRLNRTDKLNTWLELMGLTNLLEPEISYNAYKTAKIVVIGESHLKEKILTGISKALGIDTNRFEFCLDYTEAKSFNFEKLRYNSNYSLLLVGAMPHKTSGTGDFSSAITRMEQDEGFPPVIRMGSNNLKISKSSFKAALEEAINAGYITVP